MKSHFSPSYSLRGYGSLRRSRTAAQPKSSATFWKALLNLFLGTTDPVVNREAGSEENLTYTVYDPISQQQIKGLSESEARTWLEQRYYR